MPSLQAEADFFHPCGAPDEIPEARDHSGCQRVGKGSQMVFQRNGRCALSNGSLMCLPSRSMTDTCRARVEREGDKYKANMEDVCSYAHLIKPWTSEIASGCSNGSLMCLPSRSLTDTGRALVEREGDKYKANMEDVCSCAHLIKPWTSEIASGCSIALLMNPEPQPVNLIVSHTRKGSAIGILTSSLISRIVVQFQPARTSRQGWANTGNGG